ncbi:MAG: hypothetical protein BHW20_00970 [Eubacterium sp. 41_20]|nr:MAG: hypothetical protein BHW20_00970 [Eubacterium sp. 41_20]
MIKKKKKIIIAIIVFVIVFICICIIMRYLHRDDEFLKGANGNAMTYINDVHPNKYKSVDEALLDVDEKVKSEKQLCQNVNCFDFMKDNEGYTYCGGRVLNIDFVESLAEDSYTWEETFVSDLSQSMLHTFKASVEKKYKAIPAWGVTDYSDISNVTVDDQKIDEVHELDVDGKTYYLWIINDLKTRNKASEVRIESVDKTTQNR